MKLNFSAVLICFFILCFSFLSIAEEKNFKKSHLAAAEELLIEMQVGSNFSKMIENMMDLQIKQSPQLKDYRDVMLTFFNKYMSWKSLKGDMIKIYASEYSEKELKELTAFYKTPVGRKSAKLMPILAQKGAQLGTTRVMSNIAELSRMISEKEKKLKEKK